MKRLALLGIILPLLLAFTYGGDGSNGFSIGESFSPDNANDIDTALDNLETGTSITASITRDIEWDTVGEVETVWGSVNIILATEIDTAAELNALTTDEDMVLDSDIGSTVQAFDADLSDLADGSLSGTKISSGLDAAVITVGTLATARMASGATLDTEWDTAAEINAATTDLDFMTTNSSLSMLTTGSVSFKTNVIGTAVGGTITSTGMLNMVYRYTGASPATFTLPAPENGMAACFRASTANVVTVDVASGTDSIILDGVALSGGDSIDSPGAAGDYICLLAVSSTQWETWGRSGTWVDGN